MGRLRGLDVAPGTLFVNDIFLRDCSYNHTEYLIATEDECKDELRWASERKSVRERVDGKVLLSLKYSTKESKREDYNLLKKFNAMDKNGTYEAALTFEERRRLQYTLQNYPNHTVDLGQAPRMRVRSAVDDDLHCITKHVGILWCPPVRRWFTSLESLYPPLLLWYYCHFVCH